MVEFTVVHIPAGQRSTGELGSTGWSEHTAAMVGHDPGTSPCRCLQRLARRDGSASSPQVGFGVNSYKPIFSVEKNRAHVGMVDDLLQSGAVLCGASAQSYDLLHLRAVLTCRIFMIPVGRRSSHHITRQTSCDWFKLSPGLGAS